MKKIAEHRAYLDQGVKFAQALFNSGNYEDCAFYLRSLSNFAWGNATGYYTNWGIESLLNQIGEKIPNNSDPAKAVRGNRVLHIASELYEVGGHTRLLLNWCKYDESSQHQILVTRQSKEHLPAKILKEYGWEVDDIIRLEIGGNLSPASRLRTIAANYDFVLLHIHPDDVIPVIAFSSGNLPPVCFVNHADHLFWIGSSISDCLIQIRESNLDLDNSRRGIQRQFYVPLIAPGQNERSSQQAVYRSQLEIANDEVMLLTTGTKYKYRPFGKHNFFEAIIPVLDANPKSRLFCAGIGPDDELAKQYPHRQIAYKGNVKDIYVYEGACDIYLEGFPFSSFLALLQAAKKNKVVQLMHEPYDAIRLFPKAVNGFEYPEDLAEWRGQLDTLIKDQQTRTALQKRQALYLQEHYSMENWKSAVNRVYEGMRIAKHTVRTPANNVYFEGINEFFLENTDLHLPINHFASLGKLGLKDKFKVLAAFFHRPKTVVFGARAFAKFLLGRSVARS